MGEYAHFLAQIETYEKEIKEEYPRSPHIPTEGNLRNVAKLVEHEITKLTLVLQNEKAQEIHFESMEKAMNKLFAIFTNICGYAGVTLKRKLRSIFGAVFASVKTVVLEFKRIEDEKEGKEVEKEENNKSQEDTTTGEKEFKVFNPEENNNNERLTPTQLVGVVWESAKRIGELSISNHVAISQEMKLISLLLLDAHEEVQALVEATEFDDFEDEELSEEEKKRVGPVAQFAKANFTLLDRVAQKLNETASEKIENEVNVIEKLEETLLIADQISKYTDEICSGMYAPQDEESIYKNTLELRRQVEKFLEVIETLDEQIPKLTAKKLVVVVRTLIGNLCAKIIPADYKP